MGVLPMNKKMKEVLELAKGIEYKLNREAAFLMIDINNTLTESEKNELKEALKRKESEFDFDIEAMCKARYDGWYHPSLQLELKNGKDDDDNDIKMVYVKNCFSNLSLLLQHLYPNLRYNKCDTFCYLDDKKVDTNDALAMQYNVVLFLKGTNISISEINGAVRHAAMQQQYNPLQEAFSKLNPANKDTNHLDNWLHTICGTEDNQLTRTVGKKWLVSAVARALNPGCYTEGTLVFMGAQGAAKTYLFQSLALSPGSYYGDRLDINNTQKCAQTLLGAHIVEMDELSAISNKEKEDYKSFLTRKTDKYVEKYSNFPTEVPRQCVFAGSTNDSTPLNDPTGSRRFWVVKVGTLDIMKLKEIKDELWYEALQLYHVWNTKEYRDSIAPFDPWVLTAEERALLDEHNAWFKVADSMSEHLKAILPFIHLNSDHMQKVRMVGNKMYVPFRLLSSIAKDFDNRISDKRLGSILSDLYEKQLSNGITSYIIEPDYSETGPKSPINTTHFGEVEWGATR